MAEELVLRQPDLLLSFSVGICLLGHACVSGGLFRLSHGSVTEFSGLFLYEYLAPHNLVEHVERYQLDALHSS